MEDGCGTQNVRDGELRRHKLYFVNEVDSTVPSKISLFGYNEEQEMYFVEPSILALYTSMKSSSYV